MRFLNLILLPCASAFLASHAAPQSACQGTVILEETFDAGVLPPGWSRTDGWLIARTPVCGAPCAQGFAATYGSVTCDCAVCFTVWCRGGEELASPWFSLPAPDTGQAIILDFCFDGYLDTTTGDCNRLLIDHEFGTTQIPMGTNFFITCPPPYFQPPFDLSMYGGQTIRLRWRSGTVDCEGILRMTVDDVRVTLFEDFVDCNGNLVPDACDIATGTSQDCNGNGVPDSCDIAAGTSLDLDGDGIPDECQCTNTFTYCTGGTNSSGKQAQIGFVGSVSITAAELVLHVRDATPGQFGIFFFGSMQTRTPFGDGFLCATGNPQRLAPHVSLDATGAGSLPLSFDTSPGDLIQPLSEHNFQFWYRDPEPPGSGFNLSNAVHVHFCP